MRFNLGAAGMETVRGVHSRLEPFVFFYIDGASSVDSEDDKWHLYALLVKSSSGQPSLVHHPAFKTPQSKRLPSFPHNRQDASQTANEPFVMATTLQDL